MPDEKIPECVWAAAQASYEEMAKQGTAWKHDVIRDLATAMWAREKRLVEVIEILMNPPLTHDAHGRVRLDGDQWAADMRNARDALAPYQEPEPANG